MDDGALGVLALTFSKSVDLHLAFAIDGVDLEHLDLEDLLDRNLDFGLVGIRSYQEGVLVLIKQTVGLFRDHRCDQDVAIILHAETSTSLSRATAVTDLPFGRPWTNSSIALLEKITSSATTTS